MEGEGVAEARTSVSSGNQCGALGPRRFCADLGGAVTFSRSTELLPTIANDDDVLERSHS